jgi:hypothetical protein
VHLERAQRVLIVRRDEHDRDVVADELEHFEAIELRHLDVEEQQVGTEIRDRFDRLESVRALRDDLDARHAGEVFAHHGPRQILIVHDGHAQSCRCVAIHRRTRAAPVRR